MRPSREGLLEGLRVVEEGEPFVRRHPSLALALAACSKYHDVPAPAPVTSAAAVPSALTAPVATRTLAPPPAPKDDHAGLSTYTNTNFRHRFSVLVPDELEEQPAPESEGGRELKSKDGVRVNAWTMCLTAAGIGTPEIHFPTERHTYCVGNIAMARDVARTTIRGLDLLGRLGRTVASLEICER